MHFENVKLNKQKINFFREDIDTTRVGKHLIFLGKLSCSKKEETNLMSVNGIVDYCPRNSGDVER
jgi:hypothetical protein